MEIAQIKNISENMIVYNNGNLPETPQIILIQDFLTEKQCDEIIALSRKSVEEPATVICQKTGKDIVDKKIRDASFTKHERNFYTLIDEKIFELTGWSSEDIEPPKVLHYDVGGKVALHHDCSDSLERNRIANFLIYLNTPEKGGETVFPKMKVMVPAKKGSCLFFNFIPNITEKSLHGCNSVKKGEKWIVSYWLKEK